MSVSKAVKFEKGVRSIKSVKTSLADSNVPARKKLILL